MQKGNIKQSWALSTFAQYYDRCQIATCTNRETQEQFKKLAFTKGDGILFVGFAEKLGVLTAGEIARRIDSLQVVELASGNLVLCEKGSNPSWEDVPICSNSNWEDVQM